MSNEGNGPQSGSSSVEIVDLSGPVKRERADAVRNRQRVLAAAASLFASQGVQTVSMDDIAREAGVGKGTLFRRFGDKAGLAVALLDERERELQAAILSGPPPLGPGAPARQRLLAFVDAYADYVLAHVDLVRMSETASPGARYRIGAYRFWVQHVAMLLTEARSDLDARAVAHALLAPLAAEAVQGVQDDLPSGPGAAVKVLVEALCPQRAARRKG